MSRLDGVGSWIGKHPYVLLILLLLLFLLVVLAIPALRPSYVFA